MSTLSRRGLRLTAVRSAVQAALCVMSLALVGPLGCSDTDDAEPARCGDGVVDPGEICDDGNLFAGDGCNPLCLPESTTTDEVCDDGEDNDGDGATDCDDRDCDDACAPPEPDEEMCDDGVDNDEDGAIDCDDTDCDTATRCQPEICGDGEDNDGDGATDCDDVDCRATPACAPDDSCGDGVVDEGEACDDGDSNSDTEPNACRTTCEPASCGDGVVDRLEACDDGDANSDTEPDACRTTCRVATCGDGVVDAGEVCDGDAACTNLCTARPFDGCPGADTLWANEQLALESGAFVNDREVLITFVEADDETAATEDCLPIGGATPSVERVVVFEAPATGLYRFSPVASDGPWGLGRLASCGGRVLACSGSAESAGLPIETRLARGDLAWFVVEAGDATSARLRIESWPSEADIGEPCSDGAPPCIAGAFCDGDGLCASETEACESIPAVDGADPALVTDGVVLRMSTIGGAIDHETATCGDVGQSTTLTFTAATHGILQVSADTDAAVTVREGCGVAGTVLDCAADAPLDIELTRGQLVTLVVDDVTDRAREHELTLRFEPLLAIGQLCTGSSGRCTDDTFCDPISGRCRAEVGRTCASPFEIGDRVPDDPFGPDGASFILYPGGRADDEDPVCGVDSSDVYARWVAPRPARVTLEVGGGATVTAGSACGRSDVCGAGELTVDVDRDESLWFVVDSARESVDATLVARELAGPGEACGPADTGPVCDGALSCGRNDLASLCLEDLAGTCEGTLTVPDPIGADGEVFALDPGAPAWLGSCGVQAGGALRLVATEAGAIVLESSGAGFFVRRSCERPSSEAFCEVGGAGARSAVVPVAEGESIVVFGQFDTRTDLTARAIPSRSLDAPCDPAGRMDICEGGLFCVDGRCRSGDAPVGAPCVVGSCDALSFCAAGRCRSTLLAEGSPCLPERTDSLCELHLTCTADGPDGEFRCTTTDGELGDPCGVSVDNGCVDGLVCDVEPGLGYGECVLPVDIGGACRSDVCAVGAWCATDGESGVCAPQSVPEGPCVPGACPDGFLCIDDLCQVEPPGRVCGLDAWGAGCPPHLSCTGSEGAYACTVE